MRTALYANLGIDVLMFLLSAQPYCTLIVNEYIDGVTIYGIQNTF